MLGLPQLFHRLYYYAYVSDSYITYLFRKQVATGGDGERMQRHSFSNHSNIKANLLPVPALFLIQKFYLNCKKYKIHKTSTRAYFNHSSRVLEVYTRTLHLIAPIKQCACANISICKYINKNHNIISHTLVIEILNAPIL